MTAEQITAAINAVTAKLNAKDGLLATEVRGRVQDILATYASVVRTEKGLNAGLQELKDVQSQGLRVDQKGWAYALETLNTLDIGMLILEVARRHPESRGTHLFFETETDLSPVTTDEQWQKYIVVKKGDDGAICEVREPVNGIRNSEFGSRN